MNKFVLISATILFTYLGQSVLANSQRNLLFATNSGVNTFERCPHEVCSNPAPVPQLPIHCNGGHGQHC